LETLFFNFPLSTFRFAVRPPRFPMVTWPTKKQRLRFGPFRPGLPDGRPGTEYGEDAGRHTTCMSLNILTI
jgi:hypothetical protein